MRKHYLKPAGIQSTFIPENRPDINKWFRWLYGQPKPHEHEWRHSGNVSTCIICDYEIDHPREHEESKQ